MTLSDLIAALQDARDNRDWEALTDIDKNLEAVVLSARQLAEASSRLEEFKQDISRLNSLYEQLGLLVVQDRDNVAEQLKGVKLGRNVSAEYLKHE